MYFYRIFSVFPNGEQWKDSNLKSLLIHAGKKKYKSFTKTTVLPCLSNFCVQVYIDLYTDLSTQSVPQS